LEHLPVFLCFWIFEKMSDGVGSPLKALSAEEAAMMKRLQARAAAFSSPPSKPSAAVAPKEMSTSKKIPKIKRDPLAASAHEARYEKPSQDGAYFASKQRVVPTEASDKAASDKAHRAVMSQWKVHQERVEEARAHFERGREIHIDVETLVEAERTTKVTPADRAKALKGEGVSTARRNAVFFFYTVVLGSPPPKDEKGKDLWGGQRGVNAEIRAALFIPEGSSRIVADVLADSWAAYQTGEKATAKGSPPRGSARRPSWPSRATPSSRGRTSCSWTQHARAQSWLRTPPSSFL